MKEYYNYSVRLADNNDINSIVALHCSCFKPEEHVPVLLGDKFVKASYKWLINSGQSYVLVSEQKNEIIGVVAVCDGSFALPMLKACFSELIFSIIKKPLLIINRNIIRRMVRRSKTNRLNLRKYNSPGFAQMTIGAVKKEFRGKGIFPALIEATKTYSFKRGSKAIRAGVYKSNNSSRKVFIKKGWVEAPEIETDDTVFYVTHLD